jgi:chemotaxis protein CheC
MSSMPAMSTSQLDALREVANVASGHAATALAQLVGRRTMISVPEFSLARVAEIPGLLGYSGTPSVVVVMRLLGDVTGTIVFTLPEAGALTLGRLLLGDAASAADGFDELTRSSLAETGNIIGGAYAGVLGTMVQGIVMLSTPEIGIEPLEHVLAKEGSAAIEELGLCIETRFTLGGSDAEVGGHILLLPDAASLSVMVDALEQSARSVEWFIPASGHRRPASRGKSGTAGSSPEA